MVEDRDPVDFGLYEQEKHAFKVKFIYEKLRQDELESHVWVSLSSICHYFRQSV
jgi:tRNA pseudouridine38-40 synthase